MSFSNIPLGDLVDITSGFAFSSKNFSETNGTPIIRIRDVARGFTELRYDGEFDKKFLAQDDDLLVSMDGEFRVAEWRGGPALINQRVCRIEPKNGKLDRRFLRHFLPKELKEIEDKTPFVTVKHLSAKTIREIECPNIDIDEQRRIAAILDKADAIRRKRQQVLALADDFLKSVFLEMFGDPIKNPHGFVREKVRLHLDRSRSGIQSGPFGAALKKHEYVDAGVPVWGVENVQHNFFVDAPKLFITDEKYQELLRYSVKSGDVLISRAGTVGRMCIATTSHQHSIISTNLVRVALDPDSLTSHYFVSLFTYLPGRIGALKANNKDDAFTFLNPKTLRELEIPIPDMPRQIEFLKIAQKTKRAIGIQSEHGDGLDDLFASLSQRAFRGEL